MRRRVSRRDFLQLSGAGAAAAATGGLAGILASGRAPAYAQQTTIHWLRWNDFVPASDQLLRNKIAPEAAKALGIKLNIETINANDIQARITSAVQSGTGPDIILALSNWPQLYADSVVDVSDVAEEIGKEQGGHWDLFKIVANDGKKWLGVPWTIVAGLLTNRRSWFAEAGYPEDKFPQTWDEYRAAGKKLKAAGRPFGQTAGHTFGDAPAFWYPFLWSFGGQRDRRRPQDRRAEQQGDRRVGQVRGRLLEGVLRRRRPRLGRLPTTTAPSCRARSARPTTAPRSTSNRSASPTPTRRRRQADEGRHLPHAAAEGPGRPVHLPDADDQHADEVFEEPEAGQGVPALGRAQSRYSANGSPRSRASAPARPRIGRRTRCGRSTRSCCRSSDVGQISTRYAGHAGPSNRAAAEAVTKYVVTDMYAKAIQGMAPEEAVKWAHGELVKIYA